MKHLFDEINISAVAIVIMANGGEFDEIKFSDGKTIMLRNLIGPMLECQALNGKPKIVVTQFCRGVRHLSEYYDEEFVQIDGEIPRRAINDMVMYTFYKSR